MKVTVCDKRIPTTSGYYSFGFLDICNECIRSEELREVEKQRDEWQENIVNM